MAQSISARLKAGGQAETGLAALTNRTARRWDGQRERGRQMDRERDKSSTFEVVIAWASNVAVAASRRMYKYKKQILCDIQFSCRQPRLSLSSCFWQSLLYQLACPLTGLHTDLVLCQPTEWPNWLIYRLTELVNKLTNSLTTLYIGHLLLWVHWLFRWMEVTCIEWLAASGVEHEKSCSYSCLSHQCLPGECAWRCMCEAYESDLLVAII